MDCRFIVGSVAVVERLWSTGKYVMPSHRSSMNPYLFESIMFLRFNSRFWDANITAEAVNTARSERGSLRIQGHEIYLKEENE